MDENRYQSEEERRYNEWVNMGAKPLWTEKWFWIGLLIAALPVGIPLILSYIKDKFLAAFSMAFMLTLPYAILGLVLWGIIRRKNRKLAIGLLLGCSVPAIATFVMFGTCVFSFVA